MSKKSSRAQKRAYSPVSTFKPNEELPKDAPLMDKAKAAAKKADKARVKEKSALLRGAEKGEKKGEKPSPEEEAKMMERIKRAQEGDDPFKKLPGKPGELMQKKTLPSDPSEKPDFKKMKAKK